MSSTIMRRGLPALAIASALLLGTGLGYAQDPGDKPKDEAIEKLLDNLDGSKDPPTPPPAKSEEKKEEPKAEPAAKKPADEPKKDEQKAEDEKEDAPKKDEDTKADGDVSTKDKDIDSLLEKLGETPDQPSPDDKPKQGGGPGDEPPPNEPGQGQGQEKKDDLTGQSKQLDEHLEELTGRKKPKKNNGGGGGGGDGEAGGPMGEMVKRMREVEQRLGKTDTGEETRKKQTEIVKSLEQLIEQSKQSSSSSSSKQKQAQTKQGKPKPGSKQDSQNPGTMAGNAPNQKPEKPTNRRSLAGGKDEWGHLPPELRQELDNVFKEEALERKSDLIRRYYLSLSKKRTNREE